MNLSQTGLLAGKKALITGVADKHSIAWGIAQAMHDQGASLAFTYQEEPKGRLERNVRKLVATLGNPEDFLLFPCDVTDDSTIDALFQVIRSEWKGLDALVHCIAFADRDDLNRPFSQISRTGYKLAMEVSAYSLNVLARAAAPLMDKRGGGSIIALTYNAVEKAVPGYNAMAAAKALYPEDFLLFPCDVTDDSTIDALFQVIRSEWKGLDALVHCIAFADRDDLNRPFSQISRTGYKLAMEVSAYSLNVLARAAAPLMDKRGGGSIIALTYNAVEKAVPGYNAMAAAKAALEVGVRYLAVEFGLSKIRVNAISAGPVRTLSASAVKGLSALRRWTEEVSPLRQNITLQDVGNTAVYLASDLSRMVTGNVIYVDSGTHVLAAQVGAIEHRQQ